MSISFFSLKRWLFIDSHCFDPASFSTTGRDMIVDPNRRIMLISAISYSYKIKASTVLTFRCIRSMLIKEKLGKERERESNVQSISAKCKRCFVIQRTSLCWWCETDDSTFRWKQFPPDYQICSVEFDVRQMTNRNSIGRLIFEIRTYDAKYAEIYRDRFSLCCYSRCVVLLIVRIMHDS